MKTLIVNADDFGLCDGVNAAVIDAYEAGSLTSTTLMVNGAAATDAAQLATRHPGLGVGLHFNLTLGRPSADPCDVAGLLAPDGEFPARGVLARRLLLGRVPVAQIVRELDAQLAAFRALGLTPTHVDSHQHVHAFAPVFDVLARACAERALALRQPWVARPAGSHSIGRALRTGVLEGMNRRNHRRWRGQVRSNLAFTSVFDLGAVPAPLHASHYRALLDAVGGASPCELMVHLSRHEDDVAGLTRIGAVSHAEWACLRDGTLAHLAAELGWRLRSWRDAFDEDRP